MAKTGRKRGKGMTNEESIERLKSIKSLVVKYDDVLALRMAIKSLEQELIIDKIRAEINEEYKDESEHPYGQGLRRALQIIDKYKAESEDKEWID